MTRFLQMVVMLMCVGVANASELHPAQELIIKTSDKMIYVLEAEKKQSRDNPDRIDARADDYVLPR